MKNASQKIVITRVFNANLELVWKTWTDPEHIMQWWGPNGFTSPSALVDFQEGGKSVVCMKAPIEFGGQNMYSSWSYKKIIPMERIEYIDNLCDKDGNKLDPATLGMPPDFPHDMLTVITFKDLGNNKTELTLTKYHSMEGQMFEMAKMGTEQSIDKLEHYVSTQFKIRQQLNTKKMARVSTYLNFSNNTEDAFKFYQSIFGGELNTQRFGDIPASEEMPPLSDEDKKLILHIELPILGGHVLMGTDAPESMGFNLNFGNNVHIQLEPDTREETKKLFDALSDGGTITMDLQDMFWGAYYGSCTDKFGVQWMVNCLQK